jgi:putative flippase GtrA
MIRHFFTRQFLLFVGVSGTAALANWLSRMAFSLWLSLPVAVLSAYAVGMVVAFVLSILHVFPASQKPRLAQARDFVLVNLVSCAIVWLVTLGLQPLLLGWGVPWDEAIAHAIGLAAPMFFAFLAYKFFAFKDSDLDRG